MTNALLDKFEAMKRVKREAQMDADKFVARLNDIWKTPR